MGFQVNDKTVALLQMQGSKIKKLQKKCVRKTTEGAFLRIPRGDGSETLIRITSQQPYLGAVLSYSKFEVQTVDFRIKQATRVSHLLNRWLLGRTGLTTRHRLGVWYMCVFAYLTHGLHYTGITVESLMKVDILIIKQLRRLYRSPAHMDKLTNLQFLQKYHLKDPFSQLYMSCSKTVQRLHQQIPHLHANDIVRYTDITQLETGLLTIQRVIHLRRKLSAEISSLNRVAAFTCAICDASFSRQNDLKGHQTRLHGIQVGRIRTFCYASHAPTGVPIVHCVTPISQPGVCPQNTCRVDLCSTSGTGLC